MKKSVLQSLRAWLAKLFFLSSLRARLMGLLGLFLLGGFLFAATNILFFVNRAETISWQGRQGEAARGAATTVSELLEHAKLNLTYLGQINQAALATDPNILQGMIKYHPELLEVARLGTDGVAVASAFQDQPLLENMFTIPLSQWFQQARSGKTFFGGVQISATDEPYLILAVPAIDGGVVAARLHMTALWQAVADIRFGETGQAYVINQTGRIIAHTDPFVVINETSISQRAEFHSIKQFTGSTWSGNYDNFQGEPVVGVTAAIPATDWILITELSQQEAYAASRSAMLVLGSGTLLFTTLLMLLARAFLSRSVLQPMEKLREGATRIGKGELHHRIGLRQRDEIGLVAQVFDDMAARLSESARALDAQAISLAAEVTERRITEKALRQSEARYRAIVQDQTELICRFQANGVLTFVNDAYCHYFSKSREELVGFSFMPLIPQEDQDVMAGLYSQTSFSQENPLITTEHRVILANEEIRWMQWTDRAIFDDAGNLVEYQSVGRDVTERKIAEEEIKRLNAELEQRVMLRTMELAQAIDELQKEVVERKRAETEVREGQQRLQLALRAAKAGAWAWNLHTNEAVWSDENYLVMGLEPGSVAPHYTNWLACVHPEDQQAANEWVVEAVEKHGNLNIEFRIIWPDGSVHWINDIGQMNFDESGQPVGMYGIQMDITERKQIEAEIKASLHEKEVLLKEIHHRVKNNLQVIASMLNLQSSYVEDPQAQEVFQVSQNRVAAMATIHEKLYQSKNLARIDFADYIHDLTTHLFSSYEGRRQEVRLKVEADIIWLGVNTAVPCGLILNELISNALKHAFPGDFPNGQITVQFQRHSANRLRLVVADNGIGFPTHTDILHTTSLGLQLVNTLANQIGGALEIENRQGSRFQITFPTPVEGMTP